MHVGALSQENDGYVTNKPKVTSGVDKKPCMIEPNCLHADFTNTLMDCNRVIHCATVHVEYLLISLFGLCNSSVDNCGVNQARNNTQPQNNSPHYTEHCANGVTATSSF